MRNASKFDTSAMNCFSTVDSMTSFCKGLNNSVGSKNSQNTCSNTCDTEYFVPKMPENKIT